MRRSSAAVLTSSPGHPELVEGRGKARSAPAPPAPSLEPDGSAVGGAETGRSMDESLEGRIAELEERLTAEPKAVKKKPGRVLDEVLEALDTGALRAAEPGEDGEWIVHAWVKRAILLSFARFDSARIVEEEFAKYPGPLDAVKFRYRLPSYYDKLPTKRNWKKLGARCVPPGVARYGSYLGKGAILMQGFVNIGQRGESTDKRTWLTAALREFEVAV